MKNQLNLELKTPCSENFETFTKTNAGGFCNSCSKEVIDFTKMKPSEITAYFKKNSQKSTCGKFYTHQLQHSERRQTNNKLRLFSGIGLACLSLFTLGTLQAQEKEIKREVKEIKNSILVKGVVSDNSETLPGVNIVLEGTNIGTATNFDGEFTFPVPLKKGDVLLFSYLGYKTQKIIIDDKKMNSNITLKVDFEELEDVVLMGKVAVKKLYRSKNKS